MIKIIGAGMAGLLAGNLLAKHAPDIIEAAPDLPNNHSAVLRFRSPIVGDVLGIPFKPVTMVKAVVPWKNPVADALAYSYKNTGLRRSDRSVVAGLVNGTRYIAPPDLVPRMARDLKLFFNTRWQFDLSTVPTISTIPMPALMRLLDYEGYSEELFSWRAGFNIKAKVEDCDAYVSLLVPDPAYPFSRISLTGDELIIECPGKVLGSRQQLINEACMLLGIAPLDVGTPTIYPALYAKIVPIDEELRRDFIHWATIVHNIYALGRFATWRPSLLLDDLVQDIRMIDGWISRPSRYSLAKAR